MVNNNIANCKDKVRGSLHRGISVLSMSAEGPKADVTSLILEVCFTTASGYSCASMSTRPHQGHFQFSSAATLSGSGTIDCTMSVLSDSSTAPASDTNVARITAPPNTS